MFSEGALHGTKHTEHILGNAALENVNSWIWLKRVLLTLSGLGSELPLLASGLKTFLLSPF